jgi:hypothetical protein
MTALFGPLGRSDLAHYVCEAWRRSPYADLKCPTGSVAVESRGATRHQGLWGVSERKLAVAQGVSRGLLAWRGTVTDAAAGAVTDPTAGAVSGGRKQTGSPPALPAPI